MRATSLTHAVFPFVFFAPIILAGWLFFNEMQVGAFAVVTAGGAILFSLGSGNQPLSIRALVAIGYIAVLGGTMLCIDANLIPGISLAVLGITATVTSQVGMRRNSKHPVR